jgi:archaellum component FlaF (FlaF/FlaG flagellin family)
MAQSSSTNMPYINQLSAVDTVRSSDQVPIYDSSNGDARRASMALIRSFVLENYISSLTQSAAALTDNDFMAVYVAVQNEDQKVPLTSVATYIQDKLGIAPFTSQYASPSATGFTVNITNNGSDVWLILTPTAGYAAGTIVLPPVADVVDKQEVSINCTQQVNALTVNGNGAIAVTGEPLVLAADDFFRLRYDLPSSTWYRVG